MTMLTRNHHQGAIKIRETAYEEDLPEKWAATSCAAIHSSEIMRSIDGPSFQQINTLLN